MATTLDLLTLEEYAKLPDNGRPTELVRGRVVMMNVPAPKHGYICLKIATLVSAHVDRHDLGRVMSNDSAVVTQRHPDTVRGADVSYYSYHSLPKGPLPNRYLTVVPELVVEVMSPDDRWSAIHAKAAEYLEAGVAVVCVIDPKTESAHLFYPDQPQQSFSRNDELVFPEILGDFRVPVAKLFE